MPVRCHWRCPVVVVVFACQSVRAATFEDLLQSVRTPPKSETRTSDSDSQLADKIADAAVAERKNILIRGGAASELRPWAKNPVRQFPVVACRLALNARDTAALQYIPKGLRYRGRGDHFGKSMLARLYCQFGEALPAETQNAIRSEVTTWDGFLAGGTENHVNMRRTAGLLFGERFPTDDFFHHLTGRQLAAECRDYARRYGRAIYATSMVEYLSPIYLGVNTAPWMNVIDFAHDPSARIMARAILDWMLGDYAVNYGFGLLLPPLQREKGFLTGSYQCSQPTSLSQWLGWLYWGGGRMPREADAIEKLVSESEHAWVGIQHALSPWTPHPVIRNLGAKHVALPYMLWQARGNWPCIEGSHMNPYGKQQPAHEDSPQPRYHLRSVYVADDYAIGSSYRRENVMDPLERSAWPCGVVWRSDDEHNFLVVAHPFWFTRRPWEGGDDLLGDEDWSGASPFCQTAHWENVLILLYDIPTADPFRGAFGPGSPRFASQRGERNVQCAFVYAPDTMDERLAENGVHFLREGDVYLAIRPLVRTLSWQPSRHSGFVRLPLPGAVTGCVIEVGDRSEYGSFAGFRARVQAASLDLSQLERRRRVVYRSSRGHVLELQHRSRGGLPLVTINGARLDFDRWPTCASPYLNCQDRLLDINDGRQGITIDWRGRKPVYGEYTVTRRRDAR